MYSTGSSLYTLDQSKVEYWDITDSIDLRKAKDGFRLQRAVSYVSNELNIVTQKNYARESNDACDVRNLPVDWKPNYRKSERLHAFLACREQRHHDLVENMHVDMEKVNEEIGNDVRLRSEEIKAIAIELRNKICGIVEDLILTPDNATKLKPENFPLCVFQMAEIYDLVIIEIENYHERLKQIEQNRREKLKKVLQKYYMEVWKNAFLTPLDMQTFFDHQIMKINQNILGNHRLYEDIRMKLIVQCNFDIKKHLETIDYIYYDRKHASKKMDKSCSFPDDPTIQDERSILKNSISAFDDETLTRETLCHFDIESVRHKQPQTPIDSIYLEQWIDELNKTIDLLVSCSKDLIGFIKFAMNQTVNEPTIEEDIDQALPEIEEEDNELIFEDSSRSSKTSIKDLKYNLQQTFTLQKIEALWEVEFGEFHDRLQTVFKFVCDVGTLWRGHFSRINEAQNLVLKYVENVNKDHLEAQMEREMIIGTQIDKLRQEWKIKQLDDSYKKLMGFLNEKRTLISEHLGVTIAALQRYNGLIETEIELFKLEIKKFLETNPKHDMVYSVSRYNQMSRLTTILKEIKMCEYQVSAVNNWKYGLWDGIDKYLFNCDSGMRQQALEWINRQIEEINLFYDVKLELHDVREKRIRSEIYDIRKLEISNHETRFVRHKHAIEKMMEDFRDEVLKLTHHFEPRVKKIKAEIDEFNQSLTKQTKSSVVLPFKDKIAQMEFDYNQEIDNRLETINSKLTNMINEIKDSNLHYLRSLTCFGNDGNFHPLEAQVYFDHLLEIDKKIEKDVKQIRKDLIRQEKQMIKILQSATLALHMMYGNVLSDLKFAENSTQQIKQLQADLKRHVFQTKYNLGKIISEVDDIEAFITTNKTSTDPKLTTLLRNRVAHLLDSMQDLNDYLQQPKIMLKLIQEKELKIGSAEKEKRKKRSKNSAKNAKSDKTDRSTKRSTRSKFKPMDFLTKLFTEKCTNEPTFIMEMCQMIYKSLEAIQTLAIGYYKEKCSKPIVKTDMIYPEYNPFMEEIIKKYRCYHLQCEESWIDIVQEFTKSIAKFKMFLTQFEKNFVQHFRHSETEKFEKVNKDNLNVITMYNWNVKQRWEALHDKLKPLYGHPNNSALLQQLESTVYEFLDGASTNIVEEIDLFQENLDRMETDFEHKLHKICKNLDAITNKVLHEEISTNLIRQLYERIKKEKMPVKPSYLSKLKKGGKKKKPPRDEDAMSTTSKISKASKSSKASRISRRVNTSPDKFQITSRFPIPNDHRISIDLHRNRLPLPTPPEDIRDKFEISEPFQDMLVDKYDDIFRARAESTEMILTCKNMQSHIPSFMEDFQDIKQVYENSFSDALIECNITPEKWRLLWRTDVEKVLNLYIVKYK